MISRVFGSLLLAALLAACGGGGSDSSPASPDGTDQGSPSVQPSAPGENSGGGTSGDGTSGGGTSTPSTFTLNVAITGNGSVSDGSALLACLSTGSKSCTASYNAGTHVTLTATPAAGGYTFAGWSGDCASAGTAATATMTMSANTICNASFQAPTAPPATQFRGVNITGLEIGSYDKYDPAVGPHIGDDYSDYPIFDTRLIDYFKSKRVSAIRLVFQWETVQPHLYDPIPNPAWVANYQTYWNNFTKIVNYASNTAGMQVIIEPWEANSDGGVGGGRWRGCEIGATQNCASKYLNSFTVPIAAFADFWGKMATVFKDNPRVSFGLVNEPNNQSTTTWFKAAQAAITAIRNAGATQRIFVPGNGWSHAETWTQNGYDTDNPKVSNADGWLNANGPGKPLSDPLNNIAIEVHTYADTQSGGIDTSIVSATIMPERIAPIVSWAAPRGLKVYLGEIGFYANAPTVGFTPADTWKNFITYFNANPNTLLGYTWWAAGDPAWWHDVAADDGGHFSVSPTNGSTYTGDTVNMLMIQNDF